MGPQRCAEARAQGLGAAHVIRMMVGEQDGAQALATSALGLDPGDGALDLLGIRRRWLDEHDLARADQVHVGVRRRWQRRRAQREHAQPALQLEGSVTMATASLLRAPDEA